MRCLRVGVSQSKLGESSKGRRKERVADERGKKQGSGRDNADHEIQDPGGRHVAAKAQAWPSSRERHAGTNPRYAGERGLGLYAGTAQEGAGMAVYEEEVGTVCAGSCYLKVG